MKGYKGFNKNMKCMGFQYEVGGEYEEPEVKICEKGFHFCEYPLDVFAYYAPADSRYAVVEGSGDIDASSGNSKVCCSKLQIKAEIGLKDLIEAGAKFIMDKLDWENAAATNTGDYSAAINTGDYSAATNTGNCSVATNTGHYSAVINTGSRSAATNTGDRSAATNIGHYSVAANTGFGSATTNTGHRSTATNTGHNSAAINSGDSSAAINTGNHSAATNTGDYSVTTNTGDNSAATNIGDRSVAMNTGASSIATVDGEESVAISLGFNGKAKGALGCWLVLAEWEADWNCAWHRTNVRCGLVDGDNIKPDTYYVLKNGEFVEVCEEDIDD